MQSFLLTNCHKLSFSGGMFRMLNSVWSTVLKFNLKFSVKQYIQHLYVVSTDHVNLQATVKGLECYVHRSDISKYGFGFEGSGLDPPPLFGQKLKYCFFLFLFNASLTLWPSVFSLL